MMRPSAAVIFMLAFCQVESSDTPKVFGNLHESSSLPCPVPCSGHLTWTRFQKQDDVLVRCTRASCWSRDGFSLSDEQYLRGNSSLTILTADYSLRGLYMAKCDSETVCEVVFTLSPEEMAHVVTPGEPIDVHLPLIDLVEVMFTASDAVQPPNLQICTVDKDKIHCSPDYKERASLLNTLQVKGGRVSDTGIYTVRDLVNDETIVNLRIRVRAVLSAVHVSPGEDLKLDLSVPGPVKVIYKSRDSADGEQICTVTNSSLECKAEYTPRTSLSYPELTLRDLSPSDSGIYSIRDRQNDEDISVYTVSVTDDRFPWWGILLIVLLVVVVLLLALVGLIEYKKNAEHREFVKVSKELKDVNELVQQARPENRHGNTSTVNAREALQKAEEVIKVLEERYRGNTKYSEQITLFCAAKRAQLKFSGEEVEGLLLTERGGMMMKMEKVMRSLQQHSGDGAGPLQGTSRDSVTETEDDLAEIEEWCRQKREELHNLTQ